MTARASVIPWEISINNTTDNSANNAAKNTESSSTDRWTIKRLLDWTADYFGEQGFEQSRLDAEVLLAEALDCKRIELYTRFDEEPPEPIKARFRDWVARHAEGEPVAYLVGHKEFFSLKFQIDANVLIPRPETEHLVTEALDAIKSFAADTPIHVVDVGTGSGCVAVSIAKHATHVNVTASDISEAALAVANENAAIHNLQDRISFAKSDLLGSVAEPEKFHIIVSNPPYIGLSEKAGLAKSVVGFEPHVALFSSGETGTEIIERLITQAADRLATGGFLFFEMSPMIADRCRELVDAVSDLNFVRFVNDLAGHKRIVVAQRN